MLKVFVNAFRTPELRRKILFVLGIVVLFRLGSMLPAPGVNVANVRQCVDQAAGGENAGLFALINVFSGGALLQLTVFALGIMPYITASIILQLLVVVIPRLEALKKEGQSGQAKITQYTRYLTVGLAILQAAGIVALARSGDLFQGACNLPLLYRPDSLASYLLIVLTMVAGTTVIMWFGELITDRGVGNGMSVLIFTQVVATFPGAMWNIRQGQGWTTFAIVIAVGLAVVALVIFIEQAQRRIPVQYAKRMVGRRMFGGSSTYIPLKVNQAGIIPVIFASSLMYLPVLWVNFNQGSPASTWIQDHLVTGEHPLYMAMFFLLIVFFTYFYVSITFNPEEVADNMKKYGGFIPGIRAGKPTQDYLAYVLSRITAPGALYLGLIALIPMLAISLVGANQNFPFGGTTILIIVGVGLDTVKQIESQLQQRNYEGFLK
ncbi:preprotein translocase subunit SecY [Aeromicrobium sp. 636]|uniref:Protein translocase subunit SecY n=1 Tax=Aeromicrobium senzhongii TaxID=2663859 RepID=A0A8I0EY70_9ACTN|nr:MULTISPECIES: preprotein translocase subunit SecY [Aeromicrobium]MBC9227420.1 preprotein translocase subunit SecY [Aeromicrobium senzhongii]MCQ3999517.1 preprotein translocase subunit SecY [Aeromicrobium sp. 636]MTB88171.1 preprotein translocase subunit SecY [Aeromicrobium senzhongii]QNL94838.1 preprotein translocase subunit SecY [Aeromicrobium senzhongii]